MTQPNSPDNNPLAPFIDLLETALDGFNKLGNKEAYAGIVLVVLVALFIVGALIGIELIYLTIFAILFAILFLGFILILAIFAGRDAQQPPPPQPQPGEQQPQPSSEEVPPPPTDQLAHEYLRSLLRRYNVLPFELISPGDAASDIRSPLLQEIFTPLDIAAPRPAAAWNQPETERDPQEAERASRQSVFQAISQPENRKIVLLGDPGSGKSTLAQYLTICLAGDHLELDAANRSHLEKYEWELGHRRLWPVHVLLREYAAQGLANDQEIWEYISRNLSNDPKLNERLRAFAPTLEQYVKNGQAVVVLDGLDEVEQNDQAQTRDKLKQAIIRFVDSYPQARIIVTSRPYAYGAHWRLSEFNAATLLPLTDEQIEEFIAKWYQAKQKAHIISQADAEQLIEDFRRQVDKKNNERLHELAAQPLLLTMTAILHYAYRAKPLPQKRAKLYKECIELLLERWQRGKIIPGHEAKSMTELLGITIDELLNRLAIVAYEAHKKQAKEKKGTADIPSSELVKRLCRVEDEAQRTPKERVDALTRQGLLREKDLEDRSGLLSSYGRNPQDTDTIYRFPHRSFQEYLAGLYFINDLDFPEQLVAETRRDPEKWREVVLLAAGSDELKPTMFWDMIAGLCPSDPPGEAAGPPHNDVQLTFLAGQSLLETEQTGANAGGKKGEEVRPRAQKWQRSIVTNGWLLPRDRALAGDALAALGDDRPGVLTCDEMRFCPIPAGPFWLENWDARGQWYEYAGLDKLYWLGQYPVTAAQFREFLRDRPDYEPVSKAGIERLPGNWPAVYVNWYDALALANWLDERWRAKGWLPDGCRVTLPNEVEWEKGARGGREIPVERPAVTAANLRGYRLPELMANPLSRRAYPWGDEPEQEGDLYRANNEKANINHPCAVGAFPAGVSPYGCLDMSGQVWEWTRSYTGKNFPYQATPEYETIDARNKKGMILRGGSFYLDQNACSARDRYYPPSNFDVYLGFRLAVSPFLPAGLWRL